MNPRSTHYETDPMLPSSESQSAVFGAAPSSSSSFIHIRQGKFPIGFRLVGTRTRGTGVSTYTVYMIHVRCGAKRWFIYRRFSDFDRLAALLRSEFPRSKELPHLPKKHPFRSGTSKTIVEERKPLLQTYLSELVALDYVRTSLHLMRWIAKDGNSSTVGLADPDLEGWLFKRGHLVKNWKVRWVVLKDKMLYYFRDPKNMSLPLGCVPLDRCTVENLSQRRDLTFRIVPADPKFPDFWATAQSESEFADWMTAINYARTSPVTSQLVVHFSSPSIPVPNRATGSSPASPVSPPHDGKSPYDGRSPHDSRSPYDGRSPADGRSPERSPSTSYAPNGTTPAAAAAAAASGANVLQPSPRSALQSSSMTSLSPAPPSPLLPSPSSPSLSSAPLAEHIPPQLTLSPPNALHAEDDVQLSRGRVSPNISLSPSTPLSPNAPLSPYQLATPHHMDTSMDSSSGLDADASISIPESTDSLPMLKARLDQTLLQYISDLNFNLVCLDLGSNPVSPKIDSVRSPLPEWADDGELRQEGILLTKQLKRFCREIMKMTIDDLFVSEPGAFAQNIRFWEIIDELQAYSISHPQWRRFASDLLLHLIPLTRIIPRYHHIAGDPDDAPSRADHAADAPHDAASLDDSDVVEKPMIRAVLMCFLAFLGGAVGSEFSQALHRGRITSTIAWDTSTSSSSSSSSTSASSTSSSSSSLSLPSSPLSPRTTASHLSSSHRRQLSDSVRRSREGVDAYPSCPMCDMKVAAPTLADHLNVCQSLRNMDPSLPFASAIACFNTELDKRLVELTKAQARQGGIARKIPKSDPLVKLLQISSQVVDDLKESNLKQKLDQAITRLGDLCQQKHLTEPDFTFPIFSRKLSELLSTERLKLPSNERSHKRQRSGISDITSPQSSTPSRQKRTLWGLNSIFSSSTSNSNTAPPSPMVLVSPSTPSVLEPISTPSEATVVVTPKPIHPLQQQDPQDQKQQQQQHHHHHHHHHHQHESHPHHHPSVSPTSSQEEPPGRKGSLTPMGEIRPLVGRVSFDSFETIKIISKGAFGTVWLSKKKDTGELFAIKQLKKSTISRKNMVEHVLKEREILVRTNNPYVVKLFYAFQTPKYCFLVMEYLIGGDCGSLLENLGYFDEEMAKIYIAETVLALEYLHEHGIVHRDLKPDNMLITAKGHIKLTDFGLSSIRDLEETGISVSASPKVNRPLQPQSESDTQLAEAVSKIQGASDEPYRVVGTPDYLSPEALLGIGYGTSVDWWALGVILFEFLTGIPPFNDEAPDLIFKNIIEHDIPWPNIPGEMSQEAAALITRLLTVDRNERLGKNGATEVKQDGFFLDLEWNSLLSRTNMFVPAPRSPTDTGYFSTRDYESGGGVTGVDLLDPHRNALGSDDHVVDLETQNKFSRFSFASLPEAIGRIQE